MALSEKEKEQIIEEETLRLETRRKLMAEHWQSRQGGWPSTRCAGSGQARRHRFGFLFLLLALGGLAWSVMGCRHGWKHTPEERATWVTGKLASKLDMNTEQKAKLEAIKNDLLAEHKKWDGTRLDWLAELEKQFKAEIDKETLNKMADADQAKLKASRMVLIDKLAEFHAMLDSKQRAKVAGFLEERRKKAAEK